MKNIKMEMILEQCELENDYIFTPSDLIFTEGMISNWIWVNMDIDEYLKLKYCISKLTFKSNKN